MKVAELIEIYKSEGRFYNLNGKNCRSLLAISSRATAACKIKMLVVMLNPGSSRPVNESVTSIMSINDLKNIKLIDARPDATQYQIMRLMHEFGLTSVNIINLCDIIQPKSSLIIPIINEIMLDNNESIFFKYRKEEFESYFSDDIITLLAWGGSKPVRKMQGEIKSRIKSLGAKTIEVGDSEIIRHPCPRTPHLKTKWLEDARGELNKIL